jgi:hypothetical protein
MFFFLRLKVVKIRYENWKYMNPEIKRKIHLFFHEESVMVFFYIKRVFFKLHPPFLFLPWRSSWLEVGIIGYILEGGHPMTIPPKFGCGDHLGRRSEMSDTILEGNHPRIISAKLG